MIEFKNAKEINDYCKFHYYGYSFPSFSKLQFLKYAEYFRQQSKINFDSCMMSNIKCENLEKENKKLKRAIAFMSMCSILSVAVACLTIFYII